MFFSYNFWKSVAQLGKNGYFYEKIPSSCQMSKLLEREMVLKEKYLKVAELLQKEKFAKSRVMDILNSAQTLNDITNQSGKCLSVLIFSRFKFRLLSSLKETEEQFFDGHD